MKILLRTDFMDYYDHMFCSPVFDTPDFILNRFSKNTFSRYWDLINLQSMGYDVPHVEIQKPTKTRGRKVLHADVFVHRGEQKYLINCPHGFVGSYLLVDYIESKKEATSHRLLKIGDKIFYLYYQSDDYFKSNYGSEIIIKPSNLVINVAPELENYGQ